LISIIVCSIEEHLFNRFSESLAKTIGVDYELIRIENQKEKLPIAKAYNKGASQASFDFLVFVHEDVVFHSDNWGVELVNRFRSLSNPGVLGIAGNSYHPLSPTDWWGSSNRTRHFNYIKNERNGDLTKGILTKSNDSLTKKVYCLDGVFLAVKKSVFIKYKFDEKLMGFHGYDTSFCLRISEKFNNYFVPNILLEHFSSGIINREYWKNTILANQKSKLDFVKFDLNLELKSFKRFLSKSIRSKMSLFFMFKICLLIFVKLFKRILK